MRRITARHVQVLKILFKLVKQSLVSLFTIHEMKVFHSRNYLQLAVELLRRIIIRTDKPFIVFETSYGVLYFHPFPGYFFAPS